jgi:hypothetical protein
MMKAWGLCWKGEGWILSLYMQNGDPHPTLKVRRVKGLSSSALEVRGELAEVAKLVR